MANNEEPGTIQEALAYLRRLEAIISGGALTDITAVASKTAASVQMVATAIALGQDVSDCDEFWLHTARQEMRRVASNRERVLRAAASALVGERKHRTRAREMAIAMLTAAEQPAFTDPLVRLIPLEHTDDGQAATA
jgi:hypothetical protein